MKSKVAMICFFGMSALAWMGADKAYAECKGVVATKQLATQKATASVWANLQNKDSSIKHLSKELLAQGLSSFPPAQTPEKVACSSDCSVQPLVGLISTPLVFVEDSKKRQACQPHLEKTQQTPLVYQPEPFSSVEALQAWMTDFSQGKGKEGKKMYEDCPGDCSPQFSYQVEPENKTYTMRAEVICGLPRDKKDDMYELTVSHIWRCQAVPSS
jgi:hypothetical protein